MLTGVECTLRVLDLLLLWLNSLASPFSIRRDKFGLSVHLSIDDPKHEALLYSFSGHDIMYAKGMCDR